MIKKKTIIVSFSVLCSVLMLISVSNPLKAAPRIDSIEPSSGAAGTKVTIHGSGFSPETWVSLYGGGPFIAGHCDLTNGFRSVHVEGNYAYLGGDGLSVIDISSAQNPIVVGSLSCGENCAVCVGGSYAYVIGSEGFRVIDVSNPKDPFILGSHDFKLPGTIDIGDITIHGSYAYVTHEFKYDSIDVDYSALIVYDVGNPTLPTVYGYFVMTGKSFGVSIAGSYAYVGNGSSGLQVIDITTPQILKLEGTCDTPGEAHGICIAGNYAYVADGDSGLQVIDINNPAQPFIVGSHNTPINAVNVFVSGNYAYIADQNGGMQVIDISDRFYPSRVYATDLLYDVRDIFVMWPFAYVVAREFSVIDVSHLENPSIISGVELEHPNSIYVQDGYAYTGGLSGLTILDFKNPLNPSIIGSSNLPEKGLDIVVDGSYAYIATGDSGLQMIDITSPENPFKEGDCDTPGYAKAVRIKTYETSGQNGLTDTRKYAFVADGHEGLQVIDTTFPGNSFIVSSCNTPGIAESLNISDSYAYVVDGEWGLEVFDLTDPTNPYITGSCDTPGYAQDFFVAGTYAYVADGDSGLQLIDVSAPVNPSLIQTWDLRGTIRGVSGSRDKAENQYYVLAEIGGEADSNQPTYFPILVWDPNKFAPDSPDITGIIGMLCLGIGNQNPPTDIFVADDSVLVTHCEGVLMLEENKPLENVVFIDPNTLIGMVSEGKLPGTYNLQVATRDGGHAILHNAFTYVNTPPVADDQTVSTSEDTSLIITLSGSDPDLCLLTFIVTSLPVNGNLYDGPNISGHRIMSEDLPYTVNDTSNRVTYNPDTNFIGTDSFKFRVNDGLVDSAEANVSIDITAVNDTPVIDSVFPSSQTVQYSDGIAPVTITAHDIDSDSLDASVTTGFLPNALSLSAGGCTPDGGEGVECTWTIDGIVEYPAGTYEATITVEDYDGGSAAEPVTIIVNPEDAEITFDSDNEVAIRVNDGDGLSPPFSLTIYVSESYDPVSGEPNGEPWAEAGDISRITSADISISLIPVGSGEPEPGTCTIDSVVPDGYDSYIPVVCNFDDLPVNTYTVELTVSGDYYNGYNEDVLVVYDPTLGFTTGGGWFYWPGTEDDYTGYPGDKTNFGYNMKYNKKGTNIQGNLLLIRHLANDTIYRVKSNALYGLALGQDGDSMGWASFSGKCTYKEPGWTEPIGNIEFVVYVEDRNEPGTGQDKFRIEIIDKSLSLDVPVEIRVGNIVVPHTSKSQE